MSNAELVDISIYNTVTNMKSLIAAVDAVILRSTIGTNTLDAEYDNRWDLMTGLWGVYHVGLAGDNGTDEANHCLDFLNGAMCIWYDDELTGVSVAQVNEFRTRIEAVKPGFPVFIYGSNSTCAQFARPRAVADYGINDGKAHTPPSTAWDCWQYTSTGTLPGVSGHVDRSQYYKDLAALTALLKPGGTVSTSSDNWQTGYRMYQWTQLYNAWVASGSVAADKPPYGPYSEPNMKSAPDEYLGWLAAENDFTKASGSVSLPPGEYPITATLTVT